MALSPTYLSPSPIPGKPEPLDSFFKEAIDKKADETEEMARQREEDACFC